MRAKIADSAKASMPVKWIWVGSSSCRMCQTFTEYICLFLETIHLNNDKNSNYLLKHPKQSRDQRVVLRGILYHFESSIQQYHLLDHLIRVWLSSIIRSRFDRHIYNPSIPASVSIALHHSSSSFEAMAIKEVLNRFPSRQLIGILQLFTSSSFLTYINAVRVEHSTESNGLYHRFCDYSITNEGKNSNHPSSIGAGFTRQQTVFTMYLIEVKL